MRRFKGIAELKGLAGPVHLALGVFDGLHRGHQAVIGRASAARDREGGCCGVLTFDPYPVRLLAPHQAPSCLLGSLDHKAEMLAGLGVDFMLALAFDRARAAVEAEEFIEELVDAGVKTIAVGEDWRFGRGRRGDVAMLERLAGPLGFGLEVQLPVTVEGERISSTVIRRAIHEGDLERAERMLGRRYGVSGVVVEGRKLGRTIGFPTANVDTGHQQLPPDGVWVVRVRVGDEWLGGVANLGMRPTVNGEGRSLEVHLFDWSGDLYGQVVEVKFDDYLRGERKFGSLEELKDQIAKDAESARTALQSRDSKER